MCGTCLMETCDPGQKKNKNKSPMSSVDFYTIYSSTGQVKQLAYAQKAADSGDTCIGIKSRYGIVFLAEKPKVSPLYVLESDERVKRLTSTVAMTHTGVTPDAFYLSSVMKDRLLQHKESLGEDASPGLLKTYLGDTVHYFTRHFGLRVLGINSLTGVCKDGGFSLLHTDCAGRTVSYKAACIGKGARRIKTELEKLDIDSMAVEEMIDTGVKVMYMAYDPSRDKEFDIEIGVMLPETVGLLRKLGADEIQVFVDRYSHITVDEDN